MTGGLTVSSRLNYLHNEQRLTNLQTKLTASALGVAPVDLERRLGQAGAAAGEAPDPAATFRRVIASSMAPAGPFTTASLVLVPAGTSRCWPALGPNRSTARPERRPRRCSNELRSPASLVTTRAVGKGQQRFGYLMSFVGPGGTYVASAGQALPSNRRIDIPASSPDAGLNIAIYFGKATSSAALIETNVSHLPLTGTVSTAFVPFGSSVLTLVVSPTSPLAGRWSELLPWGILVVGLLFTIGRCHHDRAPGPATPTCRTTRRREPTFVRRAAERVADASAIAVAESAPDHRGVEFAARYIPGESGIEVGGDWYSAIAIDDHRFAFVVGDVSGRGLAAATIMAGLRYTIRAYAAHWLQPERILEMAAKEINVSSDGHFATVLVGLVDNDRREVTLANAGHLPALLLDGEQSEYVEVPVGVPLGMGAPAYESMTIPIAPNSTLIAYTDGLVERRTRPSTPAWSDSARRPRSTLRRSMIFSRASWLLFAEQSL